MEVVGKDPTVIKRTTCLNCAAIIEYTLSETRAKTVYDYRGDSDTMRVLDCPQCKHTINVQFCQKGVL